MARSMLLHAGMFSVAELMKTCTLIAEMRQMRGGAAEESKRRERLLKVAEHGLGLLRYEFAIAWLRNGFPRINLGHKHAAALMATHTPRDNVLDARAPWSAFLVDVPRGLVTDGDHEVSLATVYVRQDRVYIEFGDGVQESNAWIQAVALPDLGSLRSLGPAPDMIGRLIFGVCMEMTCPTFKDRASLGPRPVKRDPRTGEPKTWTFQLTRDVKVDVRDAVRDYVRGVTRNSPTVQTLVRGHWRRQPFGKGGTERKNIFVEPYWRGPEDAPIALRKHVVTAPETPLRGG